MIVNFFLLVPSEYQSQADRFETTAVYGREGSKYADIVGVD